MAERAEQEKKGNFLNPIPDGFEDCRLPGRKIVGCWHATDEPLRTSLAFHGEKSRTLYLRYLAIPSVILIALVITVAAVAATNSENAGFIGGLTLGWLVTLVYLAYFGATGNAHRRRIAQLKSFKQDEFLLVFEEDLLSSEAEQSQGEVELLPAQWVVGWPSRLLLGNIMHSIHPARVELLGQPASYPSAEFRLEVLKDCEIMSDALFRQMTANEMEELKRVKFSGYTLDWQFWVALVFLMFFLVQRSDQGSTRYLSLANIGQSALLLIFVFFFIWTTMNALKNWLKIWRWNKDLKEGYTWTVKVSSGTVIEFLHHSHMVWTINGLPPDYRGQQFVPKNISNSRTKIV